MIQRADYIIPECYIDTNLVETLVCHGGCNHQKGCNQVARIMQDKFGERFAVGIIDADKRTPGYLKEFREIASSAHIKLLRHNVRPHFFIVVSPAADGFILACAGESKVNMADFGLPSALKEFTAETKNVMSSRDPRFKGLFRELAAQGEIRLMKSVITYLVRKTYQAADYELSALFQ